MSENKRKLLFVINDATFLVSHRLRLVQAAAASGYEIGIAAPGLTADIRRTLGNHSYLPIRLDRWGSHPLQELNTIRSIDAAIRAFRPAILHNITIKPVVYGTLAALLRPKLLVVNSIPGLGTAFSPRTTAQRLKLRLITLLYRCAYMHRRTKTIFQNVADQRVFIELGICGDRLSAVIPGAGVDLKLFEIAPEPPSPPVTVLFAGRLLSDKGFFEFCDVAARLKERRPDIKFKIVGSVVPGHPRGIPVEEVIRRCTEAGVEWNGASADMPGEMRSCHIFCLPTSYNEGLPKVLLEAAASGRPIVATSVPGCLQLLRHRENGLIVPPRDPASLETAILELADDPALRTALGQSARDEIENKGLGIDQTVDRTLDLYR